MDLLEKLMAIEEIKQLKARIYWPADGAREAFHGFGHYHETYEKIGSRRHIKTMRAERLRMDIR